jgi:NAD(P)-dependent dehydrogenase (short-subunit alcohol dehydrogenase family)
MPMTNGGSERVWMITGASSGFGRELAEAALAAGDTVVAAARRTAPLAGLAEAHPGRLDAVTLDVTDQEGAARAVADAIARHGRIDVLVNNAGRGVIGAVEEASDAELRDLMELHFLGPAALTRAVLPRMRARRSGAIVQPTSMGGRMPFARVDAYSATKFALEGLTEALAGEVSPLGIKVMIVEPGAFRTSFAGGALQQSATRLDAYEDSVGGFRSALPETDGEQPGDPAKAAAAILRALDSEHTPLRLALGTDAVDAISAYLDGARAELAAWATAGRDTGFAE